MIWFIRFWEKVLTGIKDYNIGLMEWANFQIPKLI